MTLLTFLLACATSASLPDDGSSDGSHCDAYLAVQASCPDNSWMSNYSDTDQCERVYEGATSDEERQVLESCGACLEENQDSDCTTINTDCGGSC